MLYFLHGDTSPLQIKYEELLNKIKNLIYFFLWDFMFLMKVILVFHLMSWSEKKHINL